MVKQWVFHLKIQQIYNERKYAVYELQCTVRDACNARTTMKFLLSYIIVNTSTAHAKAHIHTHTNNRVELNQGEHIDIDSKKKIEKKRISTLTHICTYQAGLAMQEWEKVCIYVHGQCSRRQCTFGNEPSISRKLTRFAKEWEAKKKLKTKREKLHVSIAFAIYG